MGFNEATTLSLARWSEGGGINGPWEGRTGCLGEEMRIVLASRYQSRPHSTKTIDDINVLLDELSQHSNYSETRTIEDGPRPRLDILRDLYTNVTPEEASLITQVILKDLRPILEPIGPAHTTVNLSKRSNIDQRLTLRQALSVWDQRLSRLYRVCSSIKEAFSALEHGTNSSLTPVVGVPVEIPKCYKGRSCEDALRPLRTAERVYCETKYDGERMQIHVDLSLPLPRQIVILSKSKRDSTSDRYATHEIIRTALGIPQEHFQQPFLMERATHIQLRKGFQTTVILEAEMVAFSERTRSIDEFWRIRDLIATTAQGPRRRVRRVHPKTSPILQDSLDSDGEPTEPIIFPSPEGGHSLDSNGTDEEYRHFMLIFFDILYIDGRSLLKEIYTTRREILGDLVNEIEGFSKLASRTPILMRKGDPVQVLQSILSTSISQFDEGLVLKANASTYGSKNLPWVKLKRDYIPGLGDCIDMAVIGAKWEKERGRELAVGTDTFTTFFAAALSKEAWKANERLHVEVLFTVSYGLTKENLEKLNFEIKAQSPVPFQRQDLLSYSFSLCPGIEPPSFLFRKPMLFELFGAGFDKPLNSKYYAIRWPRISKVYRAEERPWTEGEVLSSYTAKAYAAVGRDSSEKKAKIQVAEMWKVPPGVSPEARSLRKRISIERNLLQRLKGLKPSFRRSEPMKEAVARSSRDYLAKGGPDLPAGEPFPDPLGLLMPEGYDSESSQSPRKRRRLALAETDQFLHFDPNQSTQEIKNSETEEILLTHIPSQLPSSPLSAFSLEAVSTEVDTTDNRPDDKEISLEPILANSFILVHRPMYPIPKRRTRRPAIKSILPSLRLLSTIDALLIGLGWYERRMPPPDEIKTGVIFADPLDLEDVRDQLENQKKALGEKLGEVPEVFIFSKHYLDMYLDADKSLLPRDLAVTIFWRSHQ
ncbi:hypothetical protein FRC19_004490 [Serendipita sp. 401]|nr:hypothetical protein FRC19_004490 [Serendipita sp. 401]